MAGFFGMFGKNEEEAKKPMASPPMPSSIKPPAPRPPGVGAPPPVADFPSSIMGLKAAKPVGNKIAKSTQRIVLPAQKTGPLAPVRTGPLGTQSNLDPTMRIAIPGKVLGAASTLAASISPSDKVDLPLGIAFRSLPSQILVEDYLSKVTPADLFSIPLHLVVPQLPSGKIEFTVAQMIPFLPAIILKSSEEIQEYQNLKVLLPMMEIFTRIPADKLQAKSEAPSGRIIPDSQFDSQKTRPIPPAAPAAATVPMRIPPPAAVIPQSIPAPTPAPAQQVAAPSESEVVPFIPPPPKVSAPEPSITQEATPPVSGAPTLDSLLAAAQEALGDSPVSEQTLLVEELQQDKMDPIESTVQSTGPLPHVGESIIKSPSIPETVSLEKPVSSVVENPVIPSEVLPTPEFTSAPKATSEPVPEPSPEKASAEELDLNRCQPEQLVRMVRCSPELARSIVDYRQLRRHFGKLEELLQVPGMTRSVYHSLTGQEADLGVVISLHEILNLDKSLEITVDQVLARILLWPGVRGCVIQKGEKVFGKTSLQEASTASTQALEMLALTQRFFGMTGESSELTAPSERGSLWIQKRGASIMVFEFQEKEVPSAMKSVLYKILIEINERI